MSEEGPQLDAESTTATETPEPIVSEESPKQEAESTTATEIPTPIVSEEAPKQDAESVAATETPISTAVIQPMTSDGIAEESSETKPVSTIPAEDVPSVLCCACCAACTLFVICLPCEIIGFVVRCLCLPFKCAILCCCPPEEKAPVPGSEAAA